MPENRILIVADDLTGANDTAIQFVKQGLSALVLTHSGSPVSALLNGHDVISINTNSRGKNAAAAYSVVHQAVKQLGNGYAVYKKIDSVLRGNPGKELAAVMDALDIPLALVAPSFPANRSILEKGILYPGGKTGSGGVEAVQVFAGGSGRKTENIPLEEIRQGVQAVTDFINAHNSRGTRVFVADAVTDDDLETVYKSSAALGLPHIMAGSAGLADQLARNVGKVKDRINADPLPALVPALVIAGTRQGETAAQITALSQTMSVPVIRFKVRLVAEGKPGEAVAAAFDEAAELMKKKAGLCIIAVESMFNSEIPAGETAKDCAEGDGTSAAISDALGVLAGKLVDTFRFQVIISTGGDTSLGICRQLGINGIEPLAEIIPGVPIGRIARNIASGTARNIASGTACNTAGGTVRDTAGGAADGNCGNRYIITKSGRFGNSDSFVEIINYLGVTQ